MRRKNTTIRMKRVLTGALSLLVVMGSMSLPSYAGEAFYTTAQNVNAEDGLNRTTSNGYGHKGVSFTYDDITEDTASAVSGGTRANQGSSALTASLPSKYDAREDLNLPDIRNQNPYGTCWAFASTACAEISVLKQEGRSLNFSELALAYFTYHTVTDPLGGTSGDTNKLSSGDFLNTGGNQIYTMQAYACWVGATSESLVPYSNASSALSSGISNSYAYNDQAHLRNAYLIQTSSNTTTRNYMKQWIYTYGVIGAAYYDSDMYYNSSTNSYYNGSYASTNHAIAIVGWDDNYSKNNFSSTPSGDGAWLIRNSWGGSGNSHYSYFWISYYDVGLNSSNNDAFAFDFVSDQSSSSDEFYDHNYQYDGGYESASTSYSTGANVFTASSNETLKAVMFGTGSTNVDYTIQVYKDLSNTSNPSSGTLVNTTTGSTVFAGMHTVTLSNSVYLSKGTSFAIVVKLTKSSGSASLWQEYYCSGWFSSSVSSKSGQSFYMSGSSWYDMGKSGSGNLRIKAFTDDGGSDKKVSVTGVSIENGSKATMKVGNTLQLTAAIKPTDATNKGVTWSTSDSAKATVSSTGLVTAKAAGTVTIKVTTTDGGYTASITITIEERTAEDDISVTGVSILNGDSITLNVGDGYQLEASITPTDATNTKVTWSTSDSSVATVSSAGLVTAKASGTATITVKTKDGGFTDSIQVTVLEQSNSGFQIKAVRIDSNTVKISWSGLSQFGMLVLTRDNGYLVECISGNYGTTENTDYYAQGTQYYSYTLLDNEIESGTIYPSDSGDSDDPDDPDDPNDPDDPYNPYDPYNPFDPTIYVTDVTIQNGESATMYVKSTLKLTASVKPTNATNTNVTWTSSDSSIATVSSEGKVTGVSAGKVTITATAQNGSARDSITITVKTLAAPTITSITNLKNGVKLTWKKVTGAKKYAVYRKNSSGRYERIAVLEGNSTITYTDKKAKTNGKTYTYVIKAFRGSLTRSSKAATTVFLSRTTSLKAKNVKTRSVNLSWKRNSKASGYVIRVKVGSKYKSLVVKGSMSLSVKVGQFTKGKAYKFMIRSYKKVNGKNYYSAWYTAAAVTIKK